MTRQIKKTTRKKILEEESKTKIPLLIHLFFFVCFPFFHSFKIILFLFSFLSFSKQILPVQNIELQYYLEEKEILLLCWVKWNSLLLILLMLLIWWLYLKSILNIEQAISKI